MSSPQVNLRANRRRASIIFLLVLLVTVLILVYLIFRPFWRAIVFALVIGIGFGPIHERIGHALRRRNLHALISTVAVLLIFVVPAVLLASVLSDDIVRTTRFLNDRTAPGGGILPYLTDVPQRIVSWIGRYVDLEKSGLREFMLSLPARASQTLLSLATSLVTGIAGFVGQSVITLFILFFVFRDGAGLLRQISGILPLEPQRRELLFSRVRESVFANLYGILAVALAQGLLTGAALWIAGVGSPLLLGVVAAFASLIPIVGPTLVWLPIALFFFSTGHWGKGIFILFWGALVVGTADNIIRPWIIAGRVNLHPLLVLFGLIGGVEQFGFSGLFIGPVVISLALALFDMLREDIGQRETV
jgi:predicted PurR-regulated permease PerM